MAKKKIKNIEYVQIGEPKPFIEAIQIYSAKEYCTKHHIYDIERHFLIKKYGSYCGTVSDWKSIRIKEKLI